MTKEQIEYYRKASDDGTIPDEQNPIYLFSMTHTALLVQIAGKELDAVAWAKLELINRGLDKQGKWVGFEKAEAIHMPSRSQKQIRRSRRH